MREVSNELREPGDGCFKLPVVSPATSMASLWNCFSPLTPDTGVWRSLVARFKADIFCGLFMDEGNEGLELRPETLEMIGSRGLSLGFDIYGGPLEEEADEPKGETK